MITEWAVVGVIVVLIGLIASIAKPMLTLNTNLVKLNTRLDTLAEQLGQLTTKNESSHARLWEKLDAHEKRITILEHRKVS